MSYIGEASRVQLAGAAFGDVPTWIGAIATLLGVVAAAVAALFVYRQLKELRTQSKLQIDAAAKQEAELAEVRKVQGRQLEQLELEIFERRSAQARQIRLNRAVVPWGIDQGITSGHTLAMLIENTSHGAISNITARYTLPGTDNEPGVYAYWWSPQQAASLRTPDDLKSRRILMPVAIVDPGKMVQLTAHPRAERDARQLGGIVRFTDAEGRHWEVDQTGVLRELPRRDW
jgi:hypothetical protein